MASKIQYLKKTSEYSSLKDNGQKYWAAPWLLINYQKTNLDIIRVGVTASRFVGPAVVRNRLKRWVRQSFRDSLADSHGKSFDCNFIFKSNSKELFKSLKYAEFHHAFEKFLRFVNKNA